ncbi:MAG: VOC family protein [Dehalococcoidia bacterium]
MLQITRIDHISIAVPELEPELELLERVFGFRRSGEWAEDSNGAYRGVSLDVPGSSGIGWEVLAPNGEDSYVQRFLDGPSGPGFHHIAMEVADVGATVAELKALGVEPWPPPSDAGDAPDETYIHPKQGGNGFLFQFFGPETAHDGAAHERRPAPDVEHSLGVIAVNHLSHAHPAGDELAAWYERVLGMELFHRSAGGEYAGFSTRVLETSTRQMRWELLEPAGTDSFVARFIEARGPAIHHVAFEVGDWDRAVAACAHNEVPTFGEREGETDGVPWREAFIHPRYTGGFLAQFFWQASPGVWI